MTENNKLETILIVEDDRSVRDGLVLNLKLQGYRVLSANDGDEAMRMAFDAHPDLIILDIMLPGFSGLDILSELRSRNRIVPVLVLSAREKIEQKVEALELGADDYVTKPFELRELLARVDALLRRHRRFEKNDAPIAFGEVSIDPLHRKVTLGDAPVELSAKEFDLLLLLARAPGRPFDRESILNAVWGYDFDGTTRTVDNFVVSLRQKIERNPAKPKHIVTVRQIGYKLEP
ncbi:MAG: response regulator transcription factor [Myxococcales bacterium]|jgi:DNA-binding response OmpR family regulator|nr:response regulator transcription factor [Myxococcales bacterium]